MILKAVTKRSGWGWLVTIQDIRGFWRSVLSGKRSLPQAGLALMKTQGKGLRDAILCSEQALYHSNEVGTGAPLPCCGRTLSLKNSLPEHVKTGWSPAGLPQTSGPYSQHQPGLLAHLRG